jgi:hypothetical protein
MRKEHQRTECCNRHSRICSTTRVRRALFLPVLTSWLFASFGHLHMADHPLSVTLSSITRQQNCRPNISFFSPIKSILKALEYCSLSTMEHQKDKPHCLTQLPGLFTPSGMPENILYPDTSNRTMSSDVEKGVIMKPQMIGEGQQDVTYTTFRPSTLVCCSLVSYGHPRNCE